MIGLAERHQTQAMTVSASPLRIVLAGSVGSSRLTLQALLRHRANVVGVLELVPDDPSAISGFAQLNDVAAEAAVPCVGFQNINAPEIVAQVREWQPDLLFVVGLSQLVKAELLSVPKLACIDSIRHNSRAAEDVLRSRGWCLMQHRARRISL